MQFKNVAEKYLFSQLVIGEMADKNKKISEETRQAEISKKMLLLVEKGFDMGKIKIKHRSELYDR